MVYKLPSSLYDQSAAVVEGVKVIAEANNFAGEDVSRFMHGTTVATNAILEELFPEAFLTISSDLSKQFREYERLCGTVLNSFVGPEVKKYMNNLKNTLESIGIHNTYINHSNGGLMSIDESMKFPVKTALSGPAAGVVGAQYITNLIGEKN